LEKPDLYVVARFLEVLRRNGLPMKKTNLQMSTGLNYQTFLRYLSWLETHGLVQIAPSSERDGERITLTKKGVESYDRLVDWIREIVSPDF